MENSVASVNDAELDAIITELERTWLAEKTPFDENAWLAVCEELSQEASRGCGLSYEFFVQKFSAAIEGRLLEFPENHRQHAIEIAEQYGYATSDEILETQEYFEEIGVCPHGIDLGCCPAGCGS